MERIFLQLYLQRTHPYKERLLTSFSLSYHITPFITHTLYYSFVCIMYNYIRIVHRLGYRLILALYSFCVPLPYYWHKLLL